jgi:hypothetical protein
VSDFDTQSTLDSEGGTDDPPRPPSMLGNDQTALANMGRDKQTDARTISEAEGQMSHELDMAGWLEETRNGVIGWEIRRQGWTKYTTPSGGQPAPGQTVGGRGADDIGKI